MKKIYLLLILLTFVGFTSTAQDCKKTCTTETEVGEGVFLGVQIHSHKDKSGAHVIQVIEGTEAEKMGIEKGDMILSINGEEMKSSEFMVDWVGNHKAKTAVSITLKRKTEEIELTGQLGFKTVELRTETICCDETIGKMEVKEFKTYPNPNRGEFSMNFEISSDEPISAQIFDFSGNLIFEDTVYPKGGLVREFFDVNPEVSGDHILILNQNGQTLERKIVFIK